MIARTLIVLAVLSLIPIPVCAEFYKYKDANGVLRFTDNLLDVPRDQREKIQAYKEVVTPETKPELTDEEIEESALNNKNSLIEQLNRERETLEQSYKDLGAERTALLKSPPSPQDQAAYEAHRQRIEAFNAKIKSYEEQRKLFQAKVDAFNAENEKP
jgi:Domain of unknown function (DUF4124)